MASLLVVLLLGAQEPPAVDAFGDPLPKGAVLRLGPPRRGGSGRMYVRLDNWRAAIGSDGKTLVSLEPGLIRLWDVATGSLRYAEGEAGIRAAAFSLSPDGARLAVHWNDEISTWDPSRGARLSRITGPFTAGEQGAFSSDANAFGLLRPGRIEVFDARTGALLGQAPAHAGPGARYALSGDGKRTASAGLDDGLFLVGDVATGRTLLSKTVGRARLSLPAISPDGQRVAVLSRSERLSLTKTYYDPPVARVWDIATGKEVLRLPSDDRFGGDPRFSGDSARVTFTAGRDGIVWDLKSGRAIKLLKDRQVSHAELSADGKTALFVASLPGAAKPVGEALVYEVDSGRLLLKFGGGDEGSVRHASFSGDGKSAAVASHGRLAVFDVASGKERIPDGALAGVAGHSEAVAGLAATPDGRRIATAGADGRVRLWDGATGRPLAEVESEEGRAAVLAFLPDGRTLAQAGPIGLRLRETEGLKETARFLDSAGTTCFAVSPDGARIAGGNVKGELRIWGVADGQVLRRSQPSTGAFHSIAWAPGGDRIAVGLGGEVSVFRADLAGEVLRLRGTAEQALAFSPDGGTLAVGSIGVLTLWDAATGKELRRVGGLGDACRPAFSPDGTLVALAGDAVLRVVEISTGNLRLLEGHGDRTLALSFIANGKRLVSSSEDGSALVWELGRATAGPERTAVRSRATSLKALSAFAYSPDGKRLAVGGFGRLISILDTSSDGESTLPIAEGFVKALAFSPDGKTLAAGTEKNELTLWEAGSGTLLHSVKGHTQGVFGVAFSPDGSQLLSTGNCQMLRTDVSSGKVLQQHGVELFFGRVPACWSPDGTFVAASGPLRLVEVATGKPLRVLDPRGGAESLAFSRDGTRLVSADVGSSVRLWQLPEGKESGRLELPGRIRTVAMSPDGKLVAASGDDRSLRAWEYEGGRVILSAKDDQATIGALAFSPDGRMLASGNDRGRVQYWRLADGR